MADLPARKSDRGGNENIVKLTDNFSESIEGVKTGVIESINEDGEMFVDYKNNPFGQLMARSVVKIEKTDVDKAVLVVFEEGDPTLPIVIGLLYDKPASETYECNIRKEQVDHFEVDGEKLVLNAENEIVLRCGKSSLIMKRDGKILIKGVNLINRAKEVNKVKGASVQIN